MILPRPFLIGAALLFWGWRADLLWAGAIGALLLETSQIFKGRWDFTNKEFNRIWDLCTILFVGMGIYLRLSEETNAAYKFFLWFPFAFFPMVFGQIYSTRDKISMEAFSWFLRRKGADEQTSSLNFTWIYFAVCLVSAGASNQRDNWFFLGECALVAIAGWWIRPRRIHLAAWVGIFAIAAGIGFASQIGLQNLQGWLEGRASEWFTRFGRRDFDPTESRTAIGRIGRIKQSSRIVMKVSQDHGPMPDRLLQATYTDYRDEFWLTSHKDFNAIPIEPDATTWTLIAATNTPNSVRIISRLEKKRSLLSLPLTAAQVMDLPSESVETNSLGAVRGLQNPAMAGYLARFGTNSSRVVPWDARDLFIADAELPAIRKIAADLHLNLKTATDQEKLQAVEEYFDQDYRYTLYQPSAKLPANAKTPLANFLLNTHAGHCEYFATATVLLLRQLQIPARYATGYAIPEGGGKGNPSIVRERHGHAWTLAWLHGAWQEVDTTPASWEAEEEKDLPPYRSLREWWAGFSFALSEWRWLGTKGLFQKVAFGLLIPLIGFMAWRIFGKGFKRDPTDWRSTQQWPGADSDLYALERKLSQNGLGRASNETPLQWIIRIDSQVPDLSGAAREILSLHYRYRFDPAGIEPAEREQLKQLVRSALQKV